MANETLPRWDMTPFFPGLGSPEFARAREALDRDIADLAALFDAHQVGRREAAPVPIDDATTRGFEEVLDRLNAALEAIGTLEAYVYGFAATDARDEGAQAILGEILERKMRLGQLETRFVAWVGSLDVEALIARSDVARDHAYALRRATRVAAHQMSPAEEEVVAELGLTGGVAWYRLRETVAARLVVRLELDGEERELPMSEAENLAFHPERETRRRAHEAVIDGWAAVTVPLAAALNAVKGETNALVARRGWGSPLDAALFESAIDAATLDALQGAVRDALPDFRRYLGAKARALGLPVLAAYDVVAPLGAGGRAWTFGEAADFIVEQFGAYSADLADLAARAFGERWIDAEPREGKGGGGFCMAVRGDQSRIFVNYTPAYLSMSIVAHELGHAYHAARLAGRTPLQRRTPMTMAETASTFCETIVRQAALARADETERLAILDGWLQTVLGNVAFTLAMFAFERNLFAARRARELSVDELNRLILDAQEETFGDAIDPATRNPYAWARGPHFFFPEPWYYNFPYAFGLLLGLGLYARYQEDPAAFRAGYDELLAATGMDDAPALAARFGIDVRTPDFWRASLDVVRADIDRFEALVTRQAALPAPNA